MPREMGFTTTDLEEAVPRLETVWLNKDRKFTNDLLAEIENLPEMDKISKLLTGVTMIGRK